MTAGSERWRRLEEVVQAALERPTGERAAFLAEACGVDEDLRREAASLLERETRADGFLATPLGELALNAMTYSPGGTPQTDDSRIVIGSRIGAYEIRARLGVGGMGEVYRAHDHILGRDVAIKVLPAVFSADGERLARFEREARMLASLSHPHIGAIYGLEGSGEVRGLVLELVDGETLEARLERGPVPAAHALTLAVQIAEALDHAHRRGVTHRDLKPANVMLTKAGTKLLDFGLAKWIRGPSGYVNLSALRMKPNDADSLTEKGTILGTPHYMAPEQLEGKPVDARADMFAFGAVLYEMLTGRKAFDGGSAAAIIAAVLQAEPAPLAAIEPPVPRSVERLIQKCLAKDPEQRWQTARDLADELKWIADEAGRPATPSKRSAERKRLRGFGEAAALVAIASALAGWAGWSLSRPRESSPFRAVSRFAVVPSTSVPIGGFDISPDGTMLVYSGGPAGSQRLFMRRLDQFSDLPIPGTEGADAPFFSPDGRWVAFFARRNLLKVNVQTNEPPILLSHDINRWLLNNAVWVEDGGIVLARPEHPVERVSAEGGQPRPLISLNQTPREFDHHNPSLLPGGEALLFTLHESNGRFDVVTEHLASRERKVLIESAYDATYVPSGHLLFARSQTLLAVPFDVRRLAVTGPPVILVEGVATDPYNGYGAYRLSASGTLVFRPQPSQNGRTLAWVDRSGAETPLPIAPRAFGSPRVSPDGRRLAFAIADGGRHDIWTYDIATEALARLTREGDNRTPIWTRDAQRLVYASMRGDAGELLSLAADGSGAPERLVSGGSLLAPGTLSTDERLLAYVDGNSGPAGSHIFVVPTDGERTPLPFLPGPTEETEEYQPSLSPDGRWLAFMSTETGRTEIYVAAFPSAGSRRQVSVEGGREPLWSRDGRELVYRSGARIVAVPVDTTRGFSAGKPRILFEGRYVVAGLDVMRLDYDLAPDGRFLMLKPSADEQAPQSLHVVLNWVDELKRRVRKSN